VFLVSGAVAALALGSVARPMRSTPRSPRCEFITIEFDQPEREALVFSRQELVEDIQRILTNNGVRAQGSPDMMEVWQGR